MYCAKCGNPLQQEMNFCPKCGTPSSEAPPQPFVPAVSAFPEAGRGALILVLGILALVMFGPFAGIPAWVMGAKDLRKINDGRISPSERTMTQVGMVLGIVGTVLGVLVLGIVVVTLLLVFGLVTSVTEWSSVVAATIPLVAIPRRR